MKQHRIHGNEQIINDDRTKTPNIIDFPIFFKRKQIMKGEEKYSGVVGKFELYHIIQEIVGRVTGIRDIERKKIHKLGIFVKKKSGTRRKKTD